MKLLKFHLAHNDSCHTIKAYEIFKVEKVIIEVRFIRQCKML
jgi:hypothetical protein